MIVKNTGNGPLSLWTEYKGTMVLEKLGVPLVTENEHCNQQKNIERE